MVIIFFLVLFQLKVFFERFYQVLFGIIFQNKIGGGFVVLQIVISLGFFISFIVFVLVSGQVLFGIFIVFSYVFILVFMVIIGFFFLFLVENKVFVSNFLILNVVKVVFFGLGKIFGLQYESKLSGLKKFLMFQFSKEVCFLEYLYKYQGFVLYFDYKMVFFFFEDVLYCFLFYYVYQGVFFFFNDYYKVDEEFEMVFMQLLKCIQVMFNKYWFLFLEEFWRVSFLVEMVMID